MVNIDVLADVGPSPLNTQLHLSKVQLITRVYGIRQNLLTPDRGMTTPYLFIRHTLPSWHMTSITRQITIIAGGEPELCCRRHAKREGGVYAPPYALRVRKSCPESSVHMLCLCRKV